MSPSGPCSRANRAFCSLENSSLNFSLSDSTVPIIDFGQHNTRNLIIVFQSQSSQKYFLSMSSICKLKSRTSSRSENAFTFVIHQFDLCDIFRPICVCVSVSFFDWNSPCMCGVWTEQKGQKQLCCNQGVCGPLTWL